MFKANEKFNACLYNYVRYANRAKNIKNKPKINEDPKDALLREFQEEIARLKSQLGGKVGGKKGGKKKRARRGPDGACTEALCVTSCEHNNAGSCLMQVS